MNAHPVTPAVRDLVRVVERGIVSDGDAEEFFASTLASFRGVALIVAEQHSFSGWNRHQGLPEGWVTGYAGVRCADPSIDFLDRSPLGSAYLVNRDSDDASKATPVYALLQAVGLGDSAVFRVPAPLGRELTLAIYRDRGAKSFGERDRDLLRLLYPHLCAALATRSALLALDGAGLRDRDAILESDRSHAVVELERGDVTWSKRARALCRGRIGALSELGAERLDRALLRLAREYGAAPHRACERNFVSGLRVEFARLDAQRLLALFFDELAERSAPSTDNAGAAEELLAPMERRVARAASSGQSVRQMARALRIGEETVRTYLKRVYLKLGVRSRVELARALWG
ncbi:MAG TPA: helix-turn-helix transcriptional regulator [Polyangiaceae bacterium]|nr:helix-turn-helix transcriptional regulator [Polyangiaceae bacterium]